MSRLRPPASAKKDGQPAEERKATKTRISKTLMRTSCFFADRACMFDRIRVQHLRFDHRATEETMDLTYFAPCNAAKVVRVSADGAVEQIGPRIPGECQIVPNNVHSDDVGGGGGNTTL